MLKDNISQTVRKIPADMLLSAVMNVMHRKQYVVHKNSTHIEPDLNVLNKRQFYFSIDSEFFKTLFSITQHNIFP